MLRFKEHGIEQDVPVCEMVTQRRCNGVLGKNQSINSNKNEKQKHNLSNLP